MVSVQACRNLYCRHLKNDIREHENIRCVCEETGREPRFMETCPEIEAML